ncbi:helix-turn-helix domain-containing protein [Mycobacterium sp. AT1]|uniref:helix-turn-helix domain-containing protein n=1 Tax=Mycobacterium sp. AT1 TaxID=1961706 RepID=UPI00114F71EF|nr:helix-turn-helix domain-containing protein [Mycobacterium sp. AT1]
MSASQQADASTKGAERRPYACNRTHRDCLRRTRIALRLTQQTLADLSGVSRSSVQSLERGSGSIKFGSVLEMADVLGLRVDVSAAVE